MLECHRNTGKAGRYAFGLRTETRYPAMRSTHARIASRSAAVSGSPAPSVASPPPAPNSQPRLNTISRLTPMQRPAASSAWIRSAHGPTATRPQTGATSSPGPGPSTVSQPLPCTICSRQPATDRACAASAIVGVTTNGSRWRIIAPVTVSHSTVPTRAPSARVSSGRRRRLIGWASFTKLCRRLQPISWPSASNATMS